MTPLAGPLAALGCAAAASGYVAAVDPREPGHYPACPVPALTGLHCPGCGGLRAAHALAHGDLAAALGANALAVALIAAGAVALAGWLLVSLTGVRAPRVRAGAWPRVLGWAALAATAAFTVLRNVPPGAALAP
ncbi:DUF2752 domain-containing protein [Streptomyces sp. 7-21]|uniref:DUF2752 domain-containing protein n=1 Tax=Streptomyces sp. 7-21 TaxID=2802283 RepID=UPI00191E254F|nr:DUF2752 domain-containing protein [Streptomyces sp. 7-21]MBL1066823.1 DUF2752 domain-containing protein [Streptomyces sp. 7-21]